MLRSTTHSRTCTRAVSRSACAWTAAATRSTRTTPSPSPARRSTYDAPIPIAHPVTTAHGPYLARKTAGFIRALLGKIRQTFARRRDERGHVALWVSVLVHQ